MDNWIDQMRCHYSPNYIVVESTSIDKVYLYRSDKKSIYFRFMNKYWSTDLYYLPISFFHLEKRKQFEWTHYEHYSYALSKLRDTTFQNLWHKVKSASIYCNDQTVHLDDCTDKNLLIAPIIFKSYTDLICSTCGTSVDIEWIPMCTFRTNILWKLWCFSTDNSCYYFIEWFPEEVLKDIIYLIPE